jgi:nitroreductase
MATSPSELLAALNFRYATKAFDPSCKIPAETWDAIEKSLALTPSSFGLQPWKFLVIDSADTREKLKAASWGQPQVTDASHLVVLTVRTDLDQRDIESWIARLSEVQGTPIEALEGLSGMISSFSAAMTVQEKQAWNTRQIYIALGQLMTSAALMGIDTCPLEGISPTDYDAILGLAGTGYATSVACALGYRSADDKYASTPKARFPHAQVVAHV